MLADAAVRIGENPDDPGGYVERGKIYYRMQDWGNALNDIMKALELDPSSGEARTYEKMINDILDYRYKDYYNP